MQPVLSSRPHAPPVLHLGHMQGTFVLFADHTDKEPSVTTGRHEELVEAPEIPAACPVLHRTIQQKAVH